MKNLLFGLIATIMFGFAGNAQDNPLLKSVINSQMVTLVNLGKKDFDTKIDLNTWIEQQGKINPTSSELELMTKVFYYLHNNISDEQVLKGDNHILYEIVTNKDYNIETTTTGASARCGWLCWAGRVFGTIALIILFL